MKMKKISLALAALFMLQMSSHAQKLVSRDTIYPVKDTLSVQPHSSDEIGTLFHKEKGFGGYFAFYMGYTGIQKRSAFIGGARFMFVANHILGIGIGGEGFTTIPEDRTYLYSGGYGGLYLEPVVWAKKPVHLAFPMLIGGGGIYSEYTLYDPWGSYEYNSVGYFIFEPGVDVVLNMTKWFQIDLGASYRITSKIDNLLSLPDNLLYGFNYMVTFKFGKF